ncbi:helix-hairpin-helix domain-containing protein [Thermogemmatispora carboxidivorans]|uniref:helix-hairpin-helix domain-containing protein n=1 Tax=Thermogemmatispora carboxidivorans TaxID=1382306 RepID=UPI00069B0047|nr:helix-hairpin-helix domain-containing protein [Thermogemmatispora carboxidivorans]
MHHILKLTQTIQVLPSRTGYERQAVQQPMLPGLEPEPPEERRPVRSNRQLAEVLASVAELLELQHGNPYRIQAYRNAARAILALQEPITEIIARGEPLPIEGLGRRMRAHIAELLQRGTLTFSHDLLPQGLPAGARRLLAIEHIGPRTALRLYEELGIDSAERLWQAANEQRLRRLPGFGPRSEERLKQAAMRALQRQEPEPPASLGGAA